MDLFRRCMEPVEKVLRDAKMDKSTVRPCLSMSVRFDFLLSRHWSLGYH